MTSGPARRGRWLRCAALALALAGCGQSTPSRTVYASGLRNVSALTFDGSGRLWATTSAATGHAADGVWLVRPTPVKVLAVRGPLGLVWVRDTLFVTSLGRVQAFSGFDGKAFAHRRTVLSEPKGAGWPSEIVRSGDRLIMGISAACDHCATRSRWSGTIVSFRPDGSDLRVYARGIRAPVGLAQAPKGLLVSMNQRDDLGAKTTGDALAYVREGDDRRFPACYDQGGAACAGVPRPLALLDRHAAVGGVAVVGDSALVAEWATGKVLRVSLRDGKVTQFASGLKNPLAVAAQGGTVFVGDWGSGRVYRIA